MHGCPCTRQEVERAAEGVRAVEAKAKEAWAVVATAEAVRAVALWVGGAGAEEG